MRSLLTALLLCLLLPLSACSLEDAQKKLDEYTATPPSELAQKLLVDAEHAGARARRVALCQARVITKSHLPQAVIDVFTKQDGRSVVEKAKDLKRFHLAKKLKLCVAHPESQGA